MEPARLIACNNGSPIAGNGTGLEWVLTVKSYWNRSTLQVPYLHGVILRS
jgi:hypothetical protein